MYTELEAINAMLASMGEAPVLSLDVPHPYLPRAITLLARHNKLVQSNRWWFNTSKTTLTPDGGLVTAELPAGVIRIEGTRGRGYVLTAEGSVYDVQRGEFVTAPFEAVIVREVAFEDLPPEANAYISDCATLQFQGEFDGDSTKAQLLREQKRESLMLLNAMNTRLSKHNFFSKIAAKLNDMRGDRPILRDAE